MFFPTFVMSRIPQIQSEDDLKAKLQTLAKDALCSDSFLFSFCFKLLFSFTID